jgi:hypothetical protein
MCKAVALLFCLAICVPPLECQDESAESTFSPDQLDNLFAPVALYPDPLLAQLLVAATYPDEIDEAARFLRASPDPAGIDAQPWDVSVKALAHYPEALSWTADSLDWTVTVGQAYAWQPEDVMAAIQRLRAEARAVGNLETGPQQEVVVDADAIEIWPAEADTIYVPVYDPDVVYFGSGGTQGTDLVTFGLAYPIGVWLNRDFDWRHRRIFYHGWDHGPLWVLRAQSHIQLSPVYVDARLQVIATGRSVLDLKINRAALNRYSGVHRDVTFNRAEAGGQARTGGSPAGNKIIQRNMDTSDPRIDAFRGDEQEPTRAREPERRLPAPAYRAPALESRPPQEPQSSHNEAFGTIRGPFEPQAASQRGQASRSEMAAPPAHESAPRPPALETRATSDKSRR